ncbi:LysM peptidoglycan-binding domain-containing protein [Blastopirellula retiformator]|uniref:LysM domain/BON superfamily protein n=1 Tax=Blastopirellula retiformator TaxID=2527970 RepID=A0A5C5VAE6_9BACT|nr:hypothetical protein [Blastopirellula retiformator]TWT34943.1 LysM domain/BON superfamily protein [Blastopirellula retiformator]
MRKEARIGFAIVGCLAAILLYAAVKRMWLLAQVARDHGPAPTIPADQVPGKPSLVPTITIPAQPTATYVYQEPSEASAEATQPTASPASRFAIPMDADQVAANPAEKTAKPVAEIDDTPIEAAPPLSKFASRFSAPPQETPAPSEPTVEKSAEPLASLAADSMAALKSRFSTNSDPAPAAAEEKSNDNNAVPIMSSAGSLLGSLASRLASSMTGSKAAQSAATESLAPAVSLGEPSTYSPPPTAVAEAPAAETSPQASLRFVGEKPTEPKPAAPPVAAVIKPAPLVEAQPLPSRPVVTAAPREIASAAPAWKTGERKLEPVQTPVATATKPKPQPRLNRAFASTAASATLPAKQYVPAQNASTTKVAAPVADNTPHRLPPTIEVANDVEQGVTKQADPAWVQQMIESGSFIPGQRLVPTQTPQPLANPPQPPATTYIVQPGDDLAVIARRMLGDASRWGELFRLNRDVIGDYPDQMKPGITLRLPQ